MRCNAWRWLWGLIPLSIVWWIGILSEHNGIEADLKQRTEVALRAARQSWATSSLSGRDLVLSGAAAEAGEQQEAAAIASRVWGVRLVDNRTTLLDKPASYAWSAVRSERGVELAGFVPSDAARRAVLANVRAVLPSAEIDDRMRVARGVDNAEQWLAGLKFALGQLVALRSGRVDVADGRLVIEGEASSSASYQSIKSALSKGMPTGLGLQAEKVTAPAVKPYTWAAIYKARRLELSGHAPGERQRDNLAALARTAFAGAEVADRQAIASGEPRGWQSATNAVLPYLARMSEGRAELSDQQLRISGVVEQEAVAEQIRSGLTRDLPSGIVLSHAIEIDQRTLAAAQLAAKEAEAARQRAAAAEAARQLADEAARRQAEEAARQKAAADKAAADKAALEKAAADKAAADKAAADRAAADEAARRTAAADVARTQPEVRAVADKCQTLLSNAARQGTINFKRASADLDTASQPTLNELARIAAACPKIEIDIVGHTDSEGTAERNQRLSERRAAAVVDFLIEAGVEQDRLHAIGFGDSQPVAPNDTAENRARNRRIEFVVKTN